MAVTSGRMFSSRIASILHWTLFFARVFHMFIFTLWTWSRLRRQARPKTTGVAGTCKHEIIIRVASVSAHLVNARVVEHFFLRCSSFERASRSLAKTGFSGPPKVQ